MLLAAMEFVPKSRDAEAASNLSDLVALYATLLYRNGQVGESHLCEWVGPRLRLTVSATSAAALRPRASSGYARENLKEIRALCAKTPRWAIERAGSFEESLALPARAPSLYICAPHFGSDAVFALRDGKTGNAVPIYDLQMTDDHREQIVLWSDHSRAFQRIWMYSGALEMKAWHEHAAVRSDVNAGGRKIAARIELATGKPTYLELFRYYHLSDEREARRRCPGCGGRWKCPDPTNVGLSSFHFRCDRCRLVQDRGSEKNDARSAMVGEWRGGKPVPSAAELCRGLKSGRVRW